MERDALIHRNGWTIYRGGPYFTAVAGALAQYGAVPPEHWHSDWHDVFDSTEYGMDEQVELSMLPMRCGPHDAGSVVVLNHSRREVAIRDAHAPVISIKTKE